MQIIKEYKFYAGHRNQDLQDKCMRPHGHRYGVFLVFNVKRTGNITTLFGDFDAKVEPLFKEKYDHRFLMDVNDPLYKYLKMYEEDTNSSLGLCHFERPTSVENLCYKIFGEVLEFGFDLAEIRLKETDSSVVIYDHQDYLNDINFLNKI